MEDIPLLYGVGWCISFFLLDIIASHCDDDMKGSEGTFISFLLSLIWPISLPWCLVDVIYTKYAEDYSSVAGMYCDENNVVDKIQANIDSGTYSSTAEDDLKEVESAIKSTVQKNNYNKKRKNYPGFLGALHGRRLLKKLKLCKYFLEQQLTLESKDDKV